MRQINAFSRTIFKHNQVEDAFYLCLTEQMNVPDSFFVSGFHSTFLRCVLGGEGQG